MRALDIILLQYISLHVLDHLV